MTESYLSRRRLHRLEGEQISWVGECPWTNRLSLATEGGKFYSAEGMEPVQIASEAINGVAFSGDFAVFTSRTSVWAGQRSLDNRLELFGLPFGAHGVVASRFGSFFAPAGPAGIFVIRPKASVPGFECHRYQQSGEALYAYELVRVGQAESSEIFAVAARGQGIFVFSYGKDMELAAASKQFFRGNDIVSVSSLNDPEYPLGVVALSRNGEVAVILDAVSRGKPRVVNYPDIQGNPYTICAAKGHVFILTSKELVAIPDFIKHLAAGATARRTYQSWVLPVQATDMLCQGDDRLMVLANGEADELKIDDVELELNPSSENGQTLHGNGLSERDTSARLLDVEWGTNESRLIPAEV